MADRRGWLNVMGLGETQMKNVLALLAVSGVAASVATAQIGISASAVPFVDISTTGTALTGVSDDSEVNITAAALTAAGFSGNGLLAGGVAVRVGNNGAVIWNPSGTQEIGWANSNPTNTANPSIAGANPQLISDTINGNGSSSATPANSRQFLAPLWDDNTPGTGGGIRWQVIAGDLIVQWTNEDHFNAAGTGTVTYQMVVRGGVSIASGLSLVDFVYQDTSYAASQYQNDGGSATIGYKNWGVNASANDVEYGTGGGAGNTTTDPAFNGTNMQPKVGGYIAAGDVTLPHSVTIAGVPTPGSLALIGLSGLVARRRRR